MERQDFHLPGGRRSSEIKDIHRCDGKFNSKSHECGKRHTVERSENVDVRDKGDIAKSYAKAAPLGTAASFHVYVVAHVNFEREGHIPRHVADAVRLQCYPGVIPLSSFLTYHSQRISNVNRTARTKISRSSVVSMNILSQT